MRTAQADVSSAGSRFGGLFSRLLVNYGLDARLSSYIRRRGGRYTRYAGDITISLERNWGRRARGFVQKTRAMLRACGYRAHARRKLSIRRRHQRQEVTGLVVNDKVQLFRERRRWLRAVKHRARVGRPLSFSPEQLRGMLAFERMIERQREMAEQPSRPKDK